MKRVVIAIFLLVILICITGCSSVDYGIVKDKSFVPAHKTYQPMVMILNKHTQIFPRWISHPDSWSILVENDNKKEWWNVTEDYFNKVNVGDYVDRRKTNE